MLPLKLDTLSLDAHIGDTDLNLASIVVLSDSPIQTIHKVCVYFYIIYFFAVPLFLRSLWSY